MLSENGTFCGCLFDDLQVRELDIVIFEHDLERNVSEE